MNRVHVAVVACLTTLCVTPTVTAGPATAKAATALSTHQEELAQFRPTSAAIVEKAADGTVSYSDPVGDTALAPDIGAMAVTHSGSSLVFQIGIANLGPGLVEGEFLSVPIDIDRNPGTGCSGNEVSLAVLGQTAPTADFASFGRCIAGTWNFSGAQGSFAYSYVSGSGTSGPGVITLAVATTDVGTTNFVFSAGSSYNSSYYDFAGPFSFASSPPAPTPPVPAPTPPAPAPTPPAPTPPAPAPVPPAVECVVPRVVGRSLATARTMIFRANCTVGRVLRRYSARRTGTVITQAPAAGTRRAEGGRVNLIVSRGRAPRRTVSSVETLAPQTSAAMPALYKNCTNFNKKYAHGLGKVGARDRTSGDPVRNFARSTRLYNVAMSYNRGLDRDRDGIACEKA